MKLAHRLLDDSIQEFVMLRFSALSAVATSLLFLTTTLTMAENKPAKPKPTGACTITVYGIDPTCTAGLTLDGCNKVAVKVGGVAKWEEGKACPKK